MNKTDIYNIFNFSLGESMLDIIADNLENVSIDEIQKICSEQALEVIKAHCDDYRMLKHEEAV